MKKRAGRSRFIFLCAAAAVILFTVFMIIPTMNVFRMSLFVRSAYSTTEEFVWLQNFSRLMKDANFIRSMQNTILLIVVVTVVTFAFALVFAAILTREKIKGQNFFRIIFYIPNILSVVVISAIFSAIYDTNNGTLNSLLSFFKGETVAVLWKGGIYGYDQPDHCHGMAGHRLLYGYVYGIHGQHSPESLRERRAGRRRACDPVFPDYPSAYLDEYPYHTDIFYYQHHQYGLPLCESHDLRRAQRRLRGCLVLYV